MTRLLLVLLAASALALAAGVVTGLPVAAAHPTSPTDPDHDGAGPTPQNPAGTDNCPDAFNPEQIDTDGDTKTGPNPPTDTGGDACDTDDDGDRVDDAVDNCRLIENQTQADIDGDGQGDLCDDDDDADGVRDLKDNCIKVANPDQADRDDDFIGDACDPDTPRSPGGAGGGGGSGAGSGSGPGGPSADPARAEDRTRPAVRLKVGRTHRVDELQAGLAVEVAVSEACTLQAEILAGAKTARRLKLTRRVALGETEVGEGGRTYVFTEMSRRVLRRLAKARATRLTLRVTASDAAGNQTVSTRSLRLKGARR